MAYIKQWSAPLELMNSSHKLLAPNTKVQELSSISFLQVVSDDIRHRRGRGTYQIVVTHVALVLPNHTDSIGIPHSGSVSMFSTSVGRVTIALRFGFGDGFFEGELCAGEILGGFISAGCEFALRACARECGRACPCVGASVVRRVYLWGCFEVPSFCRPARKTPYRGRSQSGNRSIEPSKVNWSIVQ
jgi:hypothetical protein